MLTFGLLGAVEVWSDGRSLQVGRPRELKLLAVLLLNAGHTVPTATLANALWGEDPPKTARSQVRNSVAGIRRRLAASGVDPITAVPDGYVLNVEAGQLDTMEFTQLVSRARTAGPRDRAALLSAALDLWRGPALGGLGGQFLASQAGHWEEQRLACWEMRIEADLELGRHTAVISELAVLTDRYPLRERLTALRLHALHRSGRTAEALEVYQRCREHLVDELGIEPGAELRDAHRAILRGEPPAGLPSDGQRPPDVPRRAPSELPALVEGFVGRESELSAIATLLSTPPAPGIVPLASVDGPAGAGKSALAVRAGHMLSEHFPDGQLHVNLHGATPGMVPLTPVTVLRAFLTSMGVPAGQIPHTEHEAAARFRSVTAGRRVLVVLDDAASAEQVRALIPAGGAVLLTSRQILSTLDGARHVHLGLLSETEAVALLAGTSGAGRVAADPRAASEIVALCGHLPLAVRVAGARLTAHPQWPLGTLAELLRNEHNRLDELEHADLCVRASLEVGFGQLAEGPANLFALLGCLDMPDVTVPVAAALAGATEAEARRDLEALARAQLVPASSASRYAPHDLVRLFARERGARLAPATAHDAIRRALHWYLGAVRSAAELIQAGTNRDRFGVPTGSLVLPGRSFADAAQAGDWIEAETANLITAARRAATLPGDGAPVLTGLASMVQIAWSNRGRQAELVTVASLALRAGQSSELETLFRYDMGCALRKLGDYEAAEQELRLALESCQRGPSRLEGAILGTLGALAHMRGDLGPAVELLERAIAANQSSGHPATQIYLLNLMALAQQTMGQMREAATVFSRCVALSRELGNDYYLAGTLTNLAEHHRGTGDTWQAVEFFTEAIGVARRASAIDVLSEALWFLGAAHHDLGTHAEARVLQRQSADLLCEMGVMTAEEAETLLASPVPEPPEIFQNH
ncbi:AfsR/SARP family transcriptional regulator [Longispora albida]|uniref:AfsR/SARP family transcriptional regulator n=1 Tax=Longispora albida TaxID=203523 RepID=UPI0003AA659D|nr:BTAD domain-containing putative transcriptional regulator [Longispora albida]